MSQCIDDFYFSLLSDEEDLFPISDSRYAEELQLQEAIMSSLSSITGQNDSQSSSPNSYGSSRYNSPVPASEKLKYVVLHEQGESSSSSFCSFCSICMESKPWSEMFRNNTCSHVFCSDCVSKHIAARVQENISSVPCPDICCRVALEPEFCRSFIPEGVFERWADTLFESMVLAMKRSYCPYKDCETLLVDDAEETVRESECPSCRRLFCASCKVPWHAGVQCPEFQKLEKDERAKEDWMVMELAELKNWMRCPNCKFFVEKTEGCLHMTCRCRHEFCYKCGSPWESCSSNSCPGRN